MLFSFDSATRGGYDPAAGLIEDAKGNLYGTAATGGYKENGVVFRLNTTGQEGVLHRFTGYPGDGSRPVAGLIQGGGSLYGTTQIGGSGNCGTVFKLTP